MYAGTMDANLTQRILAICKVDSKVHHPHSLSDHAMRGGWAYDTDTERMAGLPDCRQEHLAQNSGALHIGDNIPYTIQRASVY